MTFQSLLLTSVLTLAAGCIGQQVDGPIDYRVTGGFTGHGDGTAALHIELDGTMTRTPAGDGPRITKLDRATLGDLRRAIDEANLPEHSEYVDCCDRFTYGVSVEIGGELHTVAVSDGTAVPRPIRRVMDLLDALAAE